jgi:hypothetical protein
MSSEVRLGNLKDCVPCYYHTLPGGHNVSLVDVSGAGREGKETYIWLFLGTRLVKEGHWTAFKVRATPWLAYGLALEFLYLLKSNQESVGAAIGIGVTGVFSVVYGENFTCYRPVYTLKVRIYVVVTALNP